jgi:spermidine synthase
LGRSVSPCLGSYGSPGDAVKTSCLPLKDAVPKIGGMARQLSFSFFLIGYAAVVGQVVSMRELLVVFYGNELSTAVILASWLMWTSLGSAILGRGADSIKRKRRAFGLVQLAVALLLPASIMMARSSKLLWGIPVGEVAGATKMLGISFTVLAPFCLLSGLLFALGCALHGEMTGSRERSAGAVYMTEAMGSAVGGLVLAVLLIHRLDHLQCCVLTSALLVISSAGISLDARNQEGRSLLPLGLCAVVTGLLAVLSMDLERWEKESRGWEWTGHRLVASEQTPYGVLTAVSTDGLTSFYENGLWMFAYPDPRTAEESVHLALLQHPRPEKVLLIAGCVSGSLAEALRHPSVREVECVELDPKVIELGRRVLGHEAISALDDPRVRLIHEDGRRYIRATGSRYDVVVVNLPDPLTAQLNRFYTVEFFREAMRVMGPGGVLATSLTSSQDIIGPTLLQLLGSLRDSMARVFREVLVFPGATARFFGCSEAGVIVSDPTELVNRMEQRGLGLRYVREYYLLFDLSKERLGYLQRSLKEAQAGRTNTDLAPSCYLYDFIHWSAQHEPGMRDLFLAIQAKALRWIMLLAGISGACWVLLASRRAMGRRVGPRVLYSCVVTGYTQMSLTVVIILAFQILYGHVYVKLATLIALYMVGLVVGSGQMSPRVRGSGDPVRALTWIQGAMAAYPLALLGAILLLHETPGVSSGLGIVEWILPFLSSVAGYLGGAHFALANAVYLARSQEVGKTASLIYGLDLAGSALGGLLTGVLLLPILGIPETLYLTAALNLIAFVLLASARTKNAFGLTGRAPQGAL